VDFLGKIYHWVWGIPTLVLILGIGLILSLRTGFCQLRLLPVALRSFFSCLWEEGEGRSSFRALCTALAATVGTGNLAGVAGAIAIGGPGAIFWMWICGILGMVIKFAEAVLAIHFRQKNADGEWVGGPMYMIRDGLPGVFKPLATIYAVFGIIAAFGVGNATQISTVLSAVSDTATAFGCELAFRGKLLIGVALAVLIGAMLLGGARRISRAAEVLVPFAAALYLLLGCVVLIARIQAIPAAFFAIFRGAFLPQAVTGGAVGSMLTVLRTGVSRGVFTNEAGMGTASIAHAGAGVSHPVQQGMMGIVEVFLDTIVICTMTALVILLSGVSIPYGADTGVSLTNSAFCAVIGPWVAVFISLSLCLFALATVLGWGLYGLRCAQYLFGADSEKYFVAVQILTVLLSSVFRADALWILAEIVNGLMAIPNLIALGVLSPQLISIYKSYTYGGTYENFYQCQSLRSFPHANVSSSGSGRQGGR
jgi:AGCS family alanine or glycine:cation symporter